MNKVLKYKLRNETKGSVSYESEEEGTGIGDLYIRKEVLEKPFPKMLTVTIKRRAKMKKINWDTVGFIFIILAIFALTHAVSFGFGRAYEKKILSQKSPSMAQCMKYWAPLLTER